VFQSEAVSQSLAVATSSSFTIYSQSSTLHLSPLLALSLTTVNMLPHATMSVSCSLTTRSCKSRTTVEHALNLSK
jgi:hypothetical protein